MIVASRPKTTRPVSGRGIPARTAGYDAIDSKNRRKAPPGLLRSEDRELLPEQRRRLVANARDIRRNFSIAAWAIRQHLDYVTNFSFRSDTGDEVLDDEIDKLIEEKSKKENFDVAGRLSRAQMVRIGEALRVVDGDFGFLKGRAGWIQGIEGDRIRNPGSIPDITVPGDFVHGIQLWGSGKVRGYALHKRVNDSSFEFERVVPGFALYLHADYDRIDQVRGISPLASALNSFRDTYENMNYALLRMKIEQLFALKIKRANGDDELGEVTPADDAGAESDSEVETGRTQYKIDFGNGPVLLDLDPGDDAEFLGGNSPSSNFQSYGELAIAMALKALDIPYSFYSEDFTAWSGSRQALVRYEYSCTTKRQLVKNFKDDWTGWQLGMAVDDGELKLPGRMEASDLRWKWQPRGLPWIDGLKEVSGDVLALKSYLTSPQRILERQGIAAYDVLREISQWNRQCMELGLAPLNFDIADPVALAAAVAAADGPSQGNNKNA